MSRDADATKGDTGAVAAAAPTVLVVMGVSGVGKSTIASAVAGRLGWAFQEGDDLHSAASIAKMAAGVPLDDDDRWPWLERIADWIRAQQTSGQPGVVTCSALKRAYRDRLAEPGVVFVQLDADRALIAERLGARQGHFMSASLLASQLATLEPLAPDETGVVVSLDGSPDQIAQRVVRQLVGEVDVPRA